MTRSDRFPLAFVLFLMVSLIQALSFVSMADAPAKPRPAAPAKSTAPVRVATTMDKVRLMGRFDFGDGGGPVFAFSGCSMAAVFEGPEVAVRLKPVDNKTNNRIQVILDGKPVKKIQIRTGGLVPLLGDVPPGVHTIEIVKATEAMEGELQFTAFELPKGGSFKGKPPLPLRRMEFIGDSITCGYGNEAKSQAERYSAETENFCLTHAYLAARELDVDYRVVAQSGIGMYSNSGGSDWVSTMPDFYLKTLPFRWDGYYNDDAWFPDAVVINLGTNDFSIDIDGKVYQATYTEFVKGIRARYPKALILCAMISDQKSVPYIRSMVKGLNEAGDGLVQTLFYRVNHARDGFGADWHPSARMHASMSVELVTRLKELLGW